MRRIFLLLLAACLAHAEFADPPLAEVMGNNSAAAAALEGYYNESFAQNSTALLNIGNYSRQVNLSASAIVVGLTPSMGNLSCVSDDMAVVFARGYNETYFLPPYGLDFDNDGCIESEGQTVGRYDLNVSFTFRNMSESVPFDSTLIVVPSGILGALGNASGAENLTVNATGNVTFIFQLNNPPGDNCAINNYTNLSASMPLSVNRTFTVGGRQKLFFLVAPILREQWFRDNRFDVIALSQCPLYRAEISLNGAPARNATIRTFNTTTDGFGFMSIISNKSSENGWSEDSRVSVAPAPLEAFNNSFAFVYRFNFSYSGLGENNLSLTVHDSVKSRAQYNETLLSRMLSFGGSTTETGQNASSVPSRPSEAFQTGSLTHLEISLGLVGLVLILAFLNFWVPR